TYKKGSNVMSKSQRTQKHYLASNKGQTKLTTHKFTTSASSITQILPPAALGSSNVPRESPSEPQDALPPQGKSRARSSTVLSDPSSNGECEANGCNGSISEVNESEVGGGGAMEEVIELVATMDSVGESSLGESDNNHKNAEDVEANLDECFQGSQSTVKDWATIRADIKAHLKKNSKSLSLPQLNQVLVGSKPAFILPIDGMKVPGSGLPAEFALLHGIIRLLRHFQKKGEAPMATTGHGFMMSLLKNVLVNGLPHKRQGRSLRKDSSELSMISSSPISMSHCIRLYVSALLADG
ncbi:hypothetical protein HWV62_26935, partial [Athelia sp. TMB]